MVLIDRANAIFYLEQSLHKQSLKVRIIRAGKVRFSVILFIQQNPNMLSNPYYLIWVSESILMRRAYQEMEQLAKPENLNDL